MHCFTLYSTGIYVQKSTFIQGTSVAIPETQKGCSYIKS